MHFHSYFHLQLVGVMGNIQVKEQIKNKKHWDQWLAETRHSHRGVGVREELAKVREGQGALKGGSGGCVQKNNQRKKET